MNSRFPSTLHYEEGLGTYIEYIAQDGRRLQFPAGMLLNWGFFRGHKEVICGLQGRILSTFIIPGDITTSVENP